MKFLKAFPILSIVVTFYCFTSCQDKPPAPRQEWLDFDVLRGEIILCNGQELGEVDFSTSCQPVVKEAFDLAISLLHSFEYEEAEKAFVKVIDKDPDCAMAYWGVAMSIYHALWSPPGEEQLKKGAKILAMTEGIPQTPREKDYLEAIGLYYKDWEKLDAKTRTLKMLQKLESNYYKYPDDQEAALFYALALDATADPTDKQYTHQKKAGSILEALYPGQPNHPGVAHYIIHSYDYPGLAERALPTARKYASIAPASAHAQHMPSHIFTRLGLWDESIQSNLKATSAAQCYAEAAGYEGHWDEELHGLDYLVYAYLQKGNNHKAREQFEYLGTIKKVQPMSPKVAYVFAAVPARMALEIRDWKQAANLELPGIDLDWEKLPWQKAIHHFARALGAVHLGKLEQAEKEVHTLESLHQNLVENENQYEANQVLVQWKAAKAWLNYAKGNRQEALTLMQEASDLEDNTTKRPVTPGEVLPCRELLGDLQLALGNATAALEAYEKNLEDHPNRWNGIYGAAVAANKLGRSEDAKQYFEKLILLADPEGTDRPEMKEAQEELVKIKTSLLTSSQ